MSDGDARDEHSTDAADLDVRSEGAHDPIVDPEANFSPGEVDEGPDGDAIDTDGEQDGSKEQRAALIDEVESDR